MPFIKTAASLLLATGLGATALPSAPLEARASGVQGFDISSYQSNVDFAGAYKDGARFVMIKVSDFHTILVQATQVYERELTVYRLLKAQPILTSPSPVTMTEHPKPVSSAEATTLPIPIQVPGPNKQNTSSLMVEAGPMMAKLSPECWTWSIIPPVRTVTG